MLRGVSLDASRRGVREQRGPHVHLRKNVPARHREAHACQAHPFIKECLDFYTAVIQFTATLPFTSGPGESPCVYYVMYVCRHVESHSSQKQHFIYSSRGEQSSVSRPCFVGRQPAVVAMPRADWVGGNCVICLSSGYELACAQARRRSALVPNKLCRCTLQG